MKQLSADNFIDFFREIHGYEPFPWQLQLAHKVIQNKQWPNLLDLPTGTGKTTTIDIAIFHLACSALDGTERCAPMRIFFVIDRRIVVDATYDHARKIASKLNSANSGILYTVAKRLRHLSGNNSEPLHVVRLRGGVPQERDWASSPSQPLIAVSTADQVGSRILFRGYGVSQRMWPVHAGLVGSDALWLLDEVHLSNPLLETLDFIEIGQPETGNGVIANNPRLAPFKVVKLSATPGSIDRSCSTFSLSDSDRRHTVLSKRLLASKPTSLMSWNEGCLVSKFVESTLKLSSLSHESNNNTSTDTRIKRIAVVVNRVGSARDIYERLIKEVGARATVLLLTGRIRPIDRERVVCKIEPLLAKPNRECPEQPIILVATQTIEAGVDLDVDALITEIAPLDALRQRFGRLNRLGERKNSHAVILYPSVKKPQKSEVNDWSPIQWIYGEPAYETRRWLGTLGKRIDFGIDAMEQRLNSIDENLYKRLVTAKENAPVLFPQYVDLWACTSPPPITTPEPALFLHGETKPADVRIVWRSDINSEDEEKAIFSLQCSPPSPLETLSVPIQAAQTWLRIPNSKVDIADIPTKTDDNLQNTKKDFFRFNGEKRKWQKTNITDLKPGEVIVVPSDYGGCDEHGWKPVEKNPVPDLGVEAIYHQRNKGIVRITKETIKNSFINVDSVDSLKSETWNSIVSIIENAESEFDPEMIRLSIIEVEGLPILWRNLLTEMKRRKFNVEFYDENDRAQGFIIHSNENIILNNVKEIDAFELGGYDSITDHHDSWATGVRVELSEHLTHVEDKVRTFAEKCGLSSHLINLLALAGKLHDLGKADPRFQLDLYQVPKLSNVFLSRFPDVFLAKSSSDNQRKSGYWAQPKNFRHEALSIALAKQFKAVAELDDFDRDLVLWLIGTHHGYGRPFFPPCKDSSATNKEKVQTTRVPSDIVGQELVASSNDAPLDLSQGWIELSYRLSRQYGPWELARLETIVRLADHAASAEEQN